MIRLKEGHQYLLLIVTNHSALKIVLKDYQTSTGHRLLLTIRNCHLVHMNAEALASPKDSKFTTPIIIKVETAPKSGS